MHTHTQYNHGAHRGCILNIISIIVNGFKQFILVHKIAMRFGEYKTRHIERTWTYTQRDTHTRARGVHGYQ